MSKYMLLQNQICLISRFSCTESVLRELFFYFKPLLFSTLVSRTSKITVGLRHAPCTANNNNSKIAFCTNVLNICNEVFYMGVLLTVSIITVFSD